MEELLKLSSTKLKELAKEYEIDGYKQMVKSDLINNICVKMAQDEGKIYTFGRLDILPNGYGFIRDSDIGSDVYVSASQVKKLGLRQDDIICGEVRVPIGTEKNYGLIKIEFINSDSILKALNRPVFDDLIPTYPNKRLNLGEGSISSRIIDLISPIGLGQRALIVAPPKAGKTTLLISLANDIIKYNKEIELWILLIDERPEEVTDIKDNVKEAEVYSATFDEDPTVHINVTEKVLEQAKREVEKGKNIVILMDSITRLARSYNVVLPSSGKIISGGIDPKALYMPKKFFGSARNIKNGGSLTIISTALIETGSKMDEVIFEEFKGTGNMEIILDRSLQQLRLFPAIDVNRSGTRKEELLYTKKELEDIWKLRRKLAKCNDAEAIKYLLDLIKQFESNEELIENIKYELI
ncbi:transcription termination factor Rho [Oceanivirga miroungae]|uniref:Transcription termination factor Rho n=1 Tax=Oceanivirga miroungae TaxID=1130046 RepID=A0A6I8M8L6_9FUSO|nr:transcription termination factor Rho [Oceanivirga miroungae]VWL85866.1 type III secretion system ATPase YscN [Oceanivirga miroungae]